MGLPADLLVSDRPIAEFYVVAYLTKNRPFLAKVLPQSTLSFFTFPKQFYVLRKCGGLRELLFPPSILSSIPFDCIKRETLILKLAYKSTANRSHTSSETGVVAAVKF